jgi:hypothetical protein
VANDVDSVADEGLSGAVDPIVVDAASAADRVLFTWDEGIANLGRYPTRQYAGVVLFRPATSGRGAVIAFIRERLNEVPGDGVDWTAHGRSARRAFAFGRSAGSRRCGCFKTGAHLHGLLMAKWRNHGARRRSWQSLALPV